MVVLIKRAGFRGSTRWRFADDQMARVHCRARWRGGMGGPGQHVEPRPEPRASRPARLALRYLKVDRFPFPSEGDITLSVRNANYTLEPAIGISIRVAKLPMNSVLGAQATEQRQGFMKAVIGENDDRIPWLHNDRCRGQRSHGRGANSNLGRTFLFDDR